MTPQCQNNLAAVRRQVGRGNAEIHAEDTPVLRVLLDYNRQREPHVRVPEQWLESTEIPEILKLIVSEIHCEIRLMQKLCTLFPAGYFLNLLRLMRREIHRITDEEETIINTLKENLMTLTIDFLRIVSSWHLELASGPTGSRDRLCQIREADNLPRSVYRNAVERLCEGMTAYSGADDVLGKVFSPGSEMVWLSTLNKVRNSDKTEVRAISRIVSRFRDCPEPQLRPLCEYLVKQAIKALSGNASGVAGEFSSSKVVSQGGGMGALAGAARQKGLDLSSLDTHGNETRLYACQEESRQLVQRLLLPKPLLQDEPVLEIPIVYAGTSIRGTSSPMRFNAMRSLVETSKTGCFVPVVKNQPLVTRDVEPDYDADESVKQESFGSIPSLVIAVDSSGSTATKIEGGGPQNTILESCSIAALTIFDFFEKCSKRGLPVPEIYCVNFSDSTIVRSLSADTASAKLLTVHAQNGGTSLDVDEIFRQVRGNSLQLVVITDGTLFESEQTAAKLNAPRVIGVDVYEVSSRKANHDTGDFAEQLLQKHSNAVAKTISLFPNPEKLIQTLQALVYRVYGLCPDDAEESERTA